jgi:hypothetical protein
MGVGRMGSQRTTIMAGNWGGTERAAAIMPARFSVSNLDAAIYPFSNGHLPVHSSELPSATA